MSHGLIGVDGIHLGEKAIGVVSQLIRIGQDVLHGFTLNSHLLHALVLSDQSILESNGVLVEDARSFSTEVLNDLTSYVA